MAEEIAPRFSIEITRKWLDLAERRKAYLVDLYETGRWRLFYREAELVKRLREAIEVVERWSLTEQSLLEGAARDLSVDVAAADERAVESDVSAESP